jgi:hypothetical protein
MKLFITAILLFGNLNFFATKYNDSLQLLEIKNEIHKNNRLSDSTFNSIKIFQKEFKESDKSWIEKNGSWVAAIIVGILTVFINLIINYYLRKSTINITQMQIENSKNIALKQIHSSTIISFRQKWIENLRECISEYVSLSQFIYLRVYKRKETGSDVVDLFKQLVFIHEKVTLFLNSKEKKHQEITESMKRIRRYLYSEDINEDEREKVRTETTNLTNLTKEVLKDEWTRVKNETI